MINVQPHLISLLSYIERYNYAGYDPYDALNSPLLRLLACRSKWVRIAFTQALKRLPFNLRPILGVRRAHNPKAIGLFLWGYARLYALEKAPQYLERIEYLLNLLEQSKSKGYSGNCWGYNFDWQSRAFFVPKFTPTIVNSSFIGQALLDTYKYTGMSDALDMAMPIKDFILNDLNRMKDGATFCFSYTPLDHYAVHNANLLGASLLIRLAHITGDDTLRYPALSALTYNMKYQKDDGSWYYSEKEGSHWIDSFHTGFNLEAIHYFLQLNEGTEYKDAYYRGVKYYADKFFLEDGTPKYYHNRIYPIDIHAPAQAISFFSGEGPCYRELTDRILNWTLGNMLDSTGYFYFRKGRYFTNRVPYMRWSQAWAFHALTKYMLTRSRLPRQEGVQK